MIDYEGFDPDEISGPEAKGSGSFSRLYRTSDGWLALSAERDTERERLLDMEPFAAIPECSLADRLESVFTSRSTSEWMQMLYDAGVPAFPHQTLEDARSESYARDTGLIVSERHQAFGAVEHAGVAQRLSKTPANTGTSPIFGGDTESVLIELGYTHGEIDAMRADGVIPSSGGLSLS